RKTSPPQEGYFALRSFDWWDIRNSSSNAGASLPSSQTSQQAVPHIRCWWSAIVSGRSRTTSGDPPTNATSSPSLPTAAKSAAAKAQVEATEEVGGRSNLGI
ncbi:unnamed protein product, partial [Ectocarpus fasciculatus]